MTENFNILVNKLNSFKRRYYSYKLLRGLVLTLFFLIVAYTSFSLVEYSVFLSSEIRKIIFFGFMVFTILLFIQFIGIPILKLLQIFTSLDLKSVNKIIQKHFHEIEDKLLNIIELSELAESSSSTDIVLASIDQKIEGLKVFNFNEAVQFRNLRFVFIYFIISIIASLSLLLLNSGIFTESTHRLIHYNTSFIKPAPYTFELENKTLKAKKGDSFIIRAYAHGDEIPGIVYINIEGNNYLMKSTAIGKYEFEMASVINPVHFYFTDLKYNSKKFFLELLPKPGITQFISSVFPPAYTGIENKVFENIGDLHVPHGTKVEWNFSSIDVDSLYLIFQDSSKITASESNASYLAEIEFYKSMKYNVFIQNKITNPELALSYSVDVIPDLFPEIRITQINDSLKLTRFFFKGVIGDDYGFSNLRFHYNIDNSDSTITIPFAKNLNNQEFYFSFDFNDIEDTEGIINYYFSVTDNDIIQGYKSTTSESFTFKFSNKKEMLANEKEQFNVLQNQLDESRNLAQEIKDDLKNLQLKNMDSNVSDWEKSQMVNDIISKQNKLEQLYYQIKEDNEKLNNYLNSFGEQNIEMVEKQKQIEELLEEVFTDELKALMEEFSKLAEEFDGKKLNELAKQMDLSFEDLQKQLDRNLEMLRKMKVEQKLQNVIDDVNMLSDEEHKLAEEVIEHKNYEEIKNNIEQHQIDFKNLKEQLNDALNLNKELKEPMNFDDFNEDLDDVENSFEDSKKELDKRNKKKSGSSLENTSEKLKNLAFGMQQMLDMNTMEKNIENIDNLKQILSNLIYLSFSQEEILSNLTGITAKDPALVELNQRQKNILDQSKIVKDSLYALAMRTPQITSTVNNELLVLELHINKAVNQMEEALFLNAKSSQRFVITAANNLALLLNEALENLENMMANSQPGDQQCENPGQGKPGMGSLKESAQNIKQQLQKMIDQLKKGDGNNMSQQLGESLMQHEMMQQMLRDLMNNGSVGSNATKMLQNIDNMLEQNRKELMNKTISAQTIARQNLITTRLLEAEIAEKEREYENKRESETADDFYSNPVKYFEYNEKERFTIEYLEKNSHKLNNFYISKYKQYLNNIEQGDQ